MRSFAFCLSLALLLCVQVYAQTQDPIIGSWSNAKISKNDKQYCCVPDSMTIWKYGSDYKATYSYNSLLNPSCTAMFLFVSGTNVNVVKTSSSDIYSVNYPLPPVPVPGFGDSTINVDIPVEYYRIKMLSNTEIEIYNTKNGTISEASVCDYTLYAPGYVAPSGLPIRNIIIAVVALLVVVCIVIKCKQNKQAIIIQQESGYVQPQYGNQPNVNHQQPQRYI